LAKATVRWLAAARAQHYRYITRLDAGTRRGLHADGERFDHRAFFVRDGVG
jgi:hypothetical protein